MTRKPVKFSLRSEVFNRHGGVCFYCGNQIEFGSFSVDHVHPVAEGGTDELSNLVASCKFCNSSKCSRDIDTWKAKLSDSVSIQIAKAIDRLNLMHDVYGLNESDFIEMMKAMEAAYKTAQKIDIKLFFEREDD